jgi:hypothetical protein
MILETMSGFLLVEAIILIVGILSWALSGLAIKFEWANWVWMGLLAVAVWCAFIFQGVMVAFG